MVRLCQATCWCAKGRLRGRVGRVRPALALLKQVDSGRNADRAVALSSRPCPPRGRPNCGRQADVPSQLGDRTAPPCRGPGSSLADWATVAQLGIELGRGPTAALPAHAPSPPLAWDAKASSYAAAALLLAEAELRSSAAGTANPPPWRPQNGPCPSTRPPAPTRWWPATRASCWRKCWPSSPMLRPASRPVPSSDVCSPLPWRTPPPLPCAPASCKGPRSGGLGPSQRRPTTAKQLAREGLALLGTPRYLRASGAGAAAKALLGQR